MESIEKLFGLSGTTLAYLLSLGVHLGEPVAEGDLVPVDDHFAVVGFTNSAVDLLRASQRLSAFFSAVVV